MKNMIVTQTSRDRICIAIRLVTETKENSKNCSSCSDIISLIKQAEQNWHSESCVLCNLLGEQSYGNIEEHHLAGKLNYPDTVTVCKICHQDLSEMQLKWLESERNNISSYLLGWADIFYILWIKSRKNFLRALSRKFTYQAVWFHRSIQTL